MPDDKHSPNQSDAFRPLPKPGNAMSVEAPTRTWPEKNQAAVQLGRLGGLKGGQARALSMSAERRSEIARLAAQKRWDKTRV